MANQGVQSLPPSGSGPASDPFRDLNGADVVVVLPTLNEESGLARTLQEIPTEILGAAHWSVRRLIIDGGSTDRTLEVAREWSVPVLPQSTRGKGAAIREALEFLHARGVRFAVVLDADCTYPGTMVPAMVHLLDTGSQLVVGVREPTRSAKDDAREFVHRVGNRLLNLSASQLAGLPILDLCSGFWAVNVSAVPSLLLETDGFEIEAELFTKAYRAGYTVTQIPIPYRDRVGVAKLHAVRDGIRILLTTMQFGRRTLRSAFIPPRPSRLRDYLAVALVHGADEVLVLADGSRHAEAELIAHRIQASRPGARIEIRTVPSTTVGGFGPGSSERTGPLTIALPPADGADGDRPPPGVVHLPWSGRMIAVHDDAHGLVTDGIFDHSAGFQLEYSPTRAPVLDRMRAIFANTFPNAHSKELAFLGANGHHGTLAVWKQAGPNSSLADGLGTTSAPNDPAPRVLSDDGYP